MRVRETATALAGVLLGLSGCFGDSSSGAPPALDAGGLDVTFPGMDSGGSVDSAADGGSSDAASADGGLESGTDGGAPAPAPGECVPTGSMHSPRYFALFGTLDDGRVLIAGGDTNTETLGTAEVYDPATGTFSATGSLTAPRWGYPNSLVKLPSGKFLVAGGNDAACMTTLATAELYDPTSGTWSLTKGPMTAGRSNPIAVGLANGQVLIRGGYGKRTSCTFTTTSALTSAEVYDPVSDSFAATGAAATPRAAAASTLLPTGEAFIVAGEQFGNSPFNTTAELYDPAVDGGMGAFSWSAPVPGTAGYSFAFVLSSGKVLVEGSYSGGTVSLFDPMARTFAPAAQDLISAGGGCGIRLKTGDVFLATGLTMSGTHTPQTERYDAASGVWTQTGDMSVSRWVCSMAELPNGNVLVAGGSDPSGTVLATAEVCNPHPGPGAGDAGADASAEAGADAALADAAPE